MGDGSIRLTTGAEFAHRDAPKTPVAVGKCRAHRAVCLSAGGTQGSGGLDGTPPCLPNMLPVIGRAPQHKGLWFAFGHQHHGLTNAAITGRLHRRVDYWRGTVLRSATLSRRQVLKRPFRQGAKHAYKGQCPNSFTSDPPGGVAGARAIITQPQGGADRGRPRTHFAERRGRLHLCAKRRGRPGEPGGPLPSLRDRDGLIIDVAKRGF